MANFYVTHHKYPSNPQLFVISLHKVMGIGVDESNPNFKPIFRRAESTWKVFIYTSGIDFSGEKLNPIVAGIFGSEVDVNGLIESKIAQLCGLIDWSQQGQYVAGTDSSAPVIVEQYPALGQTGVPISSPVVIRVRDLLPGSGINTASVSMTINGFAVAPNITGNKYDYTFSFKPRPVFFE